MDFAALLEEALAMADVKRGELLTATVLYVDQQGAIVDVGLKRDGVVPRADLDRMGSDYVIEQGNEVPVMVVRPEDQDGNLVLSVHQARQSVDWERAENLLQAGEMVSAQVAAANRGGLIVHFGELRGFIPASHIANLPRGLDESERQDRLSAYVGQSIDLQIIEVNPVRRRLVLSEREAQRASRDQRKQRLLEDLNEGDVCKGVVSGLRDFGAFVDLGGADGLIHISELAWHRVRYPSEVVSVGDEIEVYVLRLDREKKRIGLSLKRLKPNPWTEVDSLYAIGQLVEGTVSRVVSFGAFIELDSGIEALLHTTQISDPPPNDPSLAVFEGERLLLRVISIESDRQRMGLSLKEVADDELAEFRARRAAEKEAEAEASDEQDQIQPDAEADVIDEEQQEAGWEDDLVEDTEQAVETEAEAEASDEEDEIQPDAEADVIDEEQQDAGWEDGLVEDTEQAVETEG
jgi:small subunit ribosomal protein S1